ncbi:MAG: hypothetical protein RR595_05180 [Lysinibacillus sp.]
MDNNRVEYSDSFQTQQTIVFLKTELAKYKFENEKHRASDYYSQAVRLEQDNIRLMNKNKILSMELISLKKDFEKDTNGYHEIIQSWEVQRKKQISSIEALVKDKNELQTINKQLTATLNTAQYELLTYKQDKHELKGSENRTIIESLEKKLLDFMQETSEQIHVVLGESQKTYKQFTESNNVEKILVKEIEDKDNEIKKLMTEIASLKEQSDSSQESRALFVEGKTTKDAEVLVHLNAQIKKVIVRSMDFEELLDAKFQLLSNLEQQLNQLSMEINAR